MANEQVKKKSIKKTSFLHTDTRASVVSCTNINKAKTHFSWDFYADKIIKQNNHNILVKKYRSF